MSKILKATIIDTYQIKYKNIYDYKIPVITTDNIIITNTLDKILDNQKIEFIHVNKIFNILKLNMPPKEFFTKNLTKNEYIVQIKTLNNSYFSSYSFIKNYLMKYIRTQKLFNFNFKFWEKFKNFNFEQSETYIYTDDITKENGIDISYSYMMSKINNNSNTQEKETTMYKLPIKKYEGPICYLKHYSKYGRIPYIEYENKFYLSFRKIFEKIFNKPVAYSRLEKVLDSNEIEAIQCGRAFYITHETLVKFIEKYNWQHGKLKEFNSNFVNYIINNDPFTNDVKPKCEIDEQNENIIEPEHQIEIKQDLKNFNINGDIEIMGIKIKIDLNIKQF